MSIFEFLTILGLHLVAAGQTCHEQRLGSNPTAVNAWEQQSWRDPVSPTARSFHSAVTLEFSKCENYGDDVALLFGGENTNRGVLHDDTWVFNSSGISWNQLIPSGTGPYPRFGHSARVLTDAQGCPLQVIYFGGAIVDNNKNLQATSETWVFGPLHDLQSATFKKPVAINNNNLNTNDDTTPPATLGQLSLLVNETMYVVGGFQAPGSPDLNMTDVWRLHMSPPMQPSLWRWSKIKTTGGVPSARSFAVNENINGTLFVMGGYNVDPYSVKDKTAWFLVPTSDGAMWTWTTVAGDVVGEGTLAMASSAYDVVTQRVVVIYGTLRARLSTFWDLSFDARRHYAPSLLQANAAATSEIRVLSVVSQTNVSATLLVNESMGVDMASIGAAPYSRIGHSMCQLANEVMIFGGVAPFSAYHYNSTWYGQFGAGAGLSRKVSWRLIANDPQIEIPTALRGGATISTRQNVYFVDGLPKVMPVAIWHFGGVTLTYSPQAQLWAYFLEGAPSIAEKWFQIRFKNSDQNDTLDTLSNREFHTGVQLTNQMLIFGGRTTNWTGAFSLSQTFVSVDLTHTINSTVLSAPTSMVIKGMCAVPGNEQQDTSVPMCRYGHAAAVTDDCMYITGGSTYSCSESCNCTIYYSNGSTTGLHDAWRWNSRSNVWTQLPSMPVAMFGHSLAAMKFRGHTVLIAMGGATEMTPIESPCSIVPAALSTRTYILNLTSLDDGWTILSTTTTATPGPRFLPSTASASGKLILYGGSVIDFTANANTIDNDVRQRNAPFEKLTALNDTWYLQLGSTGAMWMPINTSNNAYQPWRSGPSAVIYEKAVLGNTNEPQIKIKRETKNENETENKTKIYNKSENGNGSGNANNFENDFDLSAQKKHDVSNFDSASLNQTTVPFLFLYGGFDYNENEMSGALPPFAKIALGCNPGYASTQFMAVMCLECGKGTYAEDSGQSTCTPCSSGVTTESTASMLETDCNTCLDNTCNGHGTCTVKKGIASCNCGVFFDDGEYCNQLQVPAIAGVLAGFVFVAIMMTVCTIRFRKRLKRVQSTANYYEEMVNERDEELVQLQGAWKIDPSEIVLQGKIASGSYGEVSKGMYGSFPCAVKMIKEGLRLFDLDMHTADFEDEIGLLRALRHPNIVFFYGAGVWRDGQPFFVTELCERGSLRSLLDRSTSIEVPRAMKFANDCAKGMTFLHSLNPPRLHRDLKADNLLVAHDWTVKLTDFGSARLLKPHQKNEWIMLPRTNPTAVESTPRNDSDNKSHIYEMTANIGTPLWLAPEAAGGLYEDGSIYGPSADVYSFGIVMNEILTTDIPYTKVGKLLNLSWRKILTQIKEGARPHIPARTNFPKFYIDLMIAAWDADPEKRPSFYQITTILEKEYPSCSDVRAATLHKPWHRHALTNPH
eukprot:m.65589 g.65589  ORF g.65589 m.65589 type:complete len:1401 (+) comp23578_c0_seq1:82-4284(+)